MHLVYVLACRRDDPLHYILGTWRQQNNIQYPISAGKFIHLKSYRTKYITQQQILDWFHRHVHFICIQELNQLGSLKLQYQPFVRQYHRFHKSDTRIRSVFAENWKSHSKQFELSNENYLMKVQTSEESQPCLNSRLTAHPSDHRRRIEPQTELNSRTEEKTNQRRTPSVE